MSLVNLDVSRKWSGGVTRQKTINGAERPVMGV